MTRRTGAGRYVRSRSSFPSAASHGSTPIRFDVRELHPVHARRPSRRAREPIGVRQDVGAVHFVVQEVEPELRLLLRLHVQLPLQPPNAFGSRQVYANLRILGSVGSTQK